MFDLQREFYPENTMMLVRRETAGQKLERKQRDIYDSHRHRIFAVAFYMSGNELEAERILTRTFVDAFHAAQEPDREQIDTALLAHLRRTFPLGQKETPASPSDCGSLGPSTVRRSDLEEAILYLPATERLVFLLTDVERYSPEEISGLLGMSRSEVLQTAFSARLRLRQVIASTIRQDAAA